MRTELKPSRSRASRCVKAMVSSHPAARTAAQRSSDGGKHQNRSEAPNLRSGLCFQSARKQVCVARCPADLRAASSRSANKSSKHLSPGPACGPGPGQTLCGLSGPVSLSLSNMCAFPSHARVWTARARAAAATPCGSTQNRSR